MAGKGSKNRVSDFGAFQSNYDLIWNKNKDAPKENKGYFLFLDDIRIPEEARISYLNKALSIASGVENKDWKIVRSYKAFCDCILKNGIPDIVSFDFDLCQEHMEHYMFVAANMGRISHENFKTKCGLDCAKFLVNECNSRGVSLPKYYIHSVNHLGVELIAKELNK